VKVGSAPVSGGISYLLATVKWLLLVNFGKPFFSERKEAKKIDSLNDRAGKSDY
jgi:hypothetical protein